MCALLNLACGLSEWFSDCIERIVMYCFFFLKLYHRFLSQSIHLLSWDVWSAQLFFPLIEFGDWRSSVFYGVFLRFDSPYWSISTKWPIKYFLIGDYCFIEVSKMAWHLFSKSYLSLSRSLHLSNLKVSHFLFLLVFKELSILYFLSNFMIDTFSI